MLSVKIIYVITEIIHGQNQTTLACSTLLMATSVEKVDSYFKEEATKEVHYPKSAEHDPFRMIKLNKQYYFSNDSSTNHNLLMHIRPLLL